MSEEYKEINQLKDLSGVKRGDKVVVKYYREKIDPKTSKKRLVMKKIEGVYYGKDSSHSNGFRVVEEAPLPPEAGEGHRNFLFLIRGEKFSYRGYSRIGVKEVEQSGLLKLLEATI